MTLHLGLPHPHYHGAEAQKEIREARRLLKERVQSSWSFPPLPADVTGFESASGRTTGGFRVHATAHTSSAPSLEASMMGLQHRFEELEFEPVEWRERDYSSESGTDNEGGGSEASSPSRRRFKFDSPDSVGTALAERRQQRKRKRQAELDEEMSWNTGLAHFVARRDAWSCAHTVQEVRILEARRDERGQSDTASDGSSSRTSRESRSTDGTSPPTSPVAKSHPPVPATVSRILPASILTMVPLAPTLMPTHPIRSRITSHSYPEIYNKIILQSRTPSVPINLRVLMLALIQGWKDDGEWPPKPAVVEKSIGRRKGKDGHLKQGVKAVGRVLRITGSESSSHGKK